MEDARVSTRVPLSHNVSQTDSPFPNPHPSSLPEWPFVHHLSQSCTALAWESHESSTGSGTDIIKGTLTAVLLEFLNYFLAVCALRLLIQTPMLLKYHGTVLDTSYFKSGPNRCYHNHKVPIVKHGHISHCIKLNSCCSLWNCLGSLLLQPHPAPCLPSPASLIIRPFMSCPLIILPTVFVCYHNSFVFASLWFFVFRLEGD